MTNETVPSIKTLNVSTPKPMTPSSATMNRIVIGQQSGGEQIVDVLASQWQPINEGVYIVAAQAGQIGKMLTFEGVEVESGIVGAGKMMNFAWTAPSLITDLEGTEINSLLINDVCQTQPKSFEACFVDIREIEYFKLSGNTPLPGGDAVVCYKPLSIKSEPFYASGAFRISPSISTVSVFDKKYSEVLEQINILRNPGSDEEDLCATDFAYWNCLRAVSDAYSLLRAEHPSLSMLPSPVVLVEDWGGIRLIWKGTNNKVVRANFGGRSDLKSYLYHESGQIYGVEALDARTIAARLEWLL